MRGTRAVMCVLVFLALWRASAAHAAFTTDLFFGVRNQSGVMALQEFLRAQQVYQGPVTGNFFALTQQGVRAFQAAHGIKTTGYFGPQTRAKANAILATSETSLSPVAPQISPEVTTRDATDLEPQALSLRGALGFGAVPVAYWFEYGSSSALGMSTAPVSPLVPGDQQVAARIEGLTPGSTYFYRLAAAKLGGSTVFRGEVRSATTPRVLQPTPSCARAAVTIDFPSNVTYDSARFSGRVDAEGSGSYFFYYGPVGGVLRETPRQTFEQGLHATVLAPAFQLEAATRYRVYLRVVQACATVDSAETGFTTASREATVQPVAPISFSIVRPLPWEVIATSNPSLPLTLRTAAPQTVTISVSGGGTVLVSESRALAAGENKITIPWNEALRAWRGGWLTLTVTQSGLASNRVERDFGRGFVFLVAGQSNTVNSECPACAPYTYRTGLVSFLTDSYTAVAPIGAETLAFVKTPPRNPLYGAGTSAQTVWVPIADRIAEDYRVPVGIVGIGVGGTKVSQWDDPNDLYPRFTYGSYLPRVDAVIWQQGPSDSMADTSKEGYQNTLTSVIGKVRSAYGYAMPWVVALESKCEPQVPSSDPDVRAGQSAVISGTPGVLPGPDTDALPHGCHYDTQSEFDGLVAAWLTTLRGSGLLIP